LESALESRPRPRAVNKIRNFESDCSEPGRGQIDRVDSSELSSPVLADALEKISNTYEKVATKTPTAIDPDATMNSLAKMEQNYSGQYAGNATIVAILGTALFEFCRRWLSTGEQLSRCPRILARPPNNMTSGADVQWMPA